MLCIFIFFYNKFNAIALPEGLTYIGSHAFDHCQGTNFKTLVIPSTVTEIGDNAFLYCSKLTTVTFTEGDNKVNPPVTVSVDGRTLTEGVDYTLEYRVSDNGKDGIVTVTGMGNYKGITSARYEINRFDHGTWIIPTATVLLLGLAVLALFIYKKKRRD